MNVPAVAAIPDRTKERRDKSSVTSDRFLFIPVVLQATNQNPRVSRGQYF
jgi:hypothetical protein